MKLRCVNWIMLSIMLFIYISGNSQNIIINGDFNQSVELAPFIDLKPPSDGWSYSQDEGVIAEARIEEDMLRCEISSPGKFPYSVQFAQGGFTLNKGHSYRLSFDVKADSPSEFGVFLGENGGNWISLIGGYNYLQKVTSEWTTVTIDFDVYTSFPYHKLSFELGMLETIIYFDNVKLKDLELNSKVTKLDFESLKGKIENPGYRLKSDFDKQFFASYKESKFNIYPTILRTPDTLFWSHALSEDIVKNLNSNENLSVHFMSKDLDPGELKGRGQFEFFQNDLAQVGSQIERDNEEVIYHMIPEILYAPVRNNTHFVFGIHMIILDNNGENVFSFLLNSHHELFVKASLFAYNPSKIELESLNQRAINVGVTAFRLMLNSEPL